MIQRNHLNAQYVSALGKMQNGIAMTPPSTVPHAKDAVCVTTLTGDLMMRECFGKSYYLDYMKPKCDAIEGCQQSMCEESGCTAKLPCTENSFMLYALISHKPWNFIIIILNLNPRAFKGVCVCVCVCVCGGGGGGVGGWMPP